MSRITGEDAGRDYYKLLGVDPAAHPAIIKNAYRTNMSELNAHPDRGGTTEQAILLNRAREILLNATLRAEYDRRRVKKGEWPPQSSVADDSPAPKSERQPTNDPVLASRTTSVQRSFRRRWLTVDDVERRFRVVDSFVDLRS